MSQSVFTAEVISGLNADIIALLEDVQGYMRNHQNQDFQSLDVNARMVMLKSRSALTLQLTSMAAWGLYQAALLAGDDIPEGMTPDEIPDALSGLPADVLPSLPQVFTDYLARSNELFQRVQSLQQAA